MANLVFCIPTINIEEFSDVNLLVEVLTKNFPQFNFGVPANRYASRFSHRYTNVETTIVVHIKTRPIFEIYLNQRCDIIDKINDVRNLDEMGFANLADKLIEFIEEINPDLSKSIMIRHSFKCHSEQVEIINFFRKYFKAFIFDEGTHPVFLLPWGNYPTDKVETKPKSVIQKFKDFLNLR